jgi:hypothetical protein
MGERYCTGPDPGSRYEDSRCSTEKPETLVCEGKLRILSSTAVSSHGIPGSREHGIPVDEQAALAEVQTEFRFYSDLARAVEYTYVIDPPLDDGYSLIAANAAALRPSVVTAVWGERRSTSQKQIFRAARCRSEGGRSRTHGVLLFELP